MSGLLDRMAKRARGALPTIEPRSTALFAPAPATAFADKETPGVGIQGAFPQEVFAEIETSRRASDGSPQQRQRPPAEQDEPESHSGERANAPSTRGPARQTARIAAQAADTSQPEKSGPLSSSSDSQQPANTLPGLEKRILPTEHRSHTESDRRDPEGPAPLEAQRYSPQSRMNAGMDQSRNQEPDASAPMESSAIRAAEKTLARSGEVTVPANAGRSRHERQEQQERMQSARNAAPAQAPVQAPEQKTEIHISIGSIELRAPRVEVRPQSAPFRPRVSLSDFLGRKPEAGA